MQLIAVCKPKEAPRRRVPQEHKRKFVPRIILRRAALEPFQIVREGRKARLELR